MNTNPAAEKTKKATFVFTDLLNAAGSWQPFFANKKNIVGCFFSAKCSNTPMFFTARGLIQVYRKMKKIRGSRFVISYSISVMGIKEKKALIITKDKKLKLIKEQVKNPNREHTRPLKSEKAGTHNVLPIAIMTIQGKTNGLINFIHLQRLNTLIFLPSHPKSGSNWR